MQASQVLASLQAISNPALASFQQRYFKTGKGEYGEGDIFLGLKVPQVREVAKAHKQLELNEIKTLAHNKYHEARFAALAILVLQYKAAKDHAIRDKLFATYLDLLKHGVVNNWDLVDATAPYLGVQLLDLESPGGYLKELAKGNLWEQRAAIMLTWAFIRGGDLKPTFLMSEYFLTHPHDLIHKACGWMLRESGKKDQQALVEFLTRHKDQMPRVMFRYAIERLPKGLV